MKQLNQNQRKRLAIILGRQPMECLRREHIDDWLALAFYLRLGNRRNLPMQAALLRLSTHIRLATCEGDDVEFLRDVVIPLTKL